MGIMGNILNRSKRVQPKVKVQKSKNVRTIRDNPKCTYDQESGLLDWADLLITPGDYIRVKHRYSDGYNQVEADEAGMFLGVEGDHLIFQTGVKKQRARLLEIHAVEVMSRIGENTEE